MKRQYGVIYRYNRAAKITGIVLYCVVSIIVAVTTVVIVNNIK